MAATSSPSDTVVVHAPRLWLDLIWITLCLSGAAFISGVGAEFVEDGEHWPFIAIYTLIPVVTVAKRMSRRVTLSEAGIASGLFSSLVAWSEIHSVESERFPDRLRACWCISSCDGMTTILQSIARTEPFQEAVERWAPDHSPTRQMLVHAS